MKLHFPLAALVLLSSPAAWAKKKPSEAATRDPHVLKLTSDGEVGFLDLVEQVEGDIPRGVPVVVDIRGLDAFTKAAVTRQLVSSGATRVVEREVLGVLRAAAAGEDGGASSSNSGAPVGAFDLPVENLQVRAPADAYRWQPPQYLLQTSIYKDPHRATAGLFLTEDLDELPKAPVCISVRSIDAATGTVASFALECGESSSESAVEMATGLVEDIASTSSTLKGGQRILQLPVEVVSGSNTQRLPVDNTLYHAVNNLLAKRGCSVQAVPPNSTSGGRDGERWSYHTVPFEPVTTTMLEGWIQAKYAISIDASFKKVSTDDLLDRLSGTMDEQLIDPDLLLARDGSEVSILELDVEAVDLGSGRLITSFELRSGRDASREMLAQVVSDVVFGGRPSAWVEVRPIPQSAAATVDGSAVRIIDGMGLVDLRPGKHTADLSLAGDAKADVRASFRTEKYQYGVLPLAAPFGSLAITTTPEGAEVLVDGQIWGNSPVERTIGGGDHEILARVEGCGEKSTTVDVLIGEENKALIHLDGFVEASVQPAQASIEINSRAVGEGQARVQVPYGANDITYKLKGYRAHKAGLMVDSCQTTTSSFSFDGTIVADSTPAGAEVRIDGEKVGNAQSRTIVPIGRHEVSCHWCEYGSGSTVVQVGPGQEVPVSIDLDGTGFRFALGAYAGMDYAPLLDSGGLRAGAMGEAWINGRWGLQAMADVGTDGDYTHIAVGPSVRALFPAPGLALPFALRADMIYQSGVGLTVIPTAALDLRICAGKATSFRIGAAGGYNPSRGGFMGSVDVGLLFRGGSPWKNSED